MGAKQAGALGLVGKNTSILTTKTLASMKRGISIQLDGSFQQGNG